MVVWLFGILFEDFMKISSPVSYHLCEVCTDFAPIDGNGLDQNVLHCR